MDILNTDRNVWFKKNLTEDIILMEPSYTIEWSI